ncbi:MULTISPECIES: MFS transporter [Nocardiopsidaceae]|uniref:MFS transporter n=1 Tax=Streptomonospora nanhaiensis TaxID=1323731 RepID=A0ABY6YU03_9ACTN|nr:MFS transporter [Streptomonospora nanhaiensis]WAE75804.1 MFS transporter [Streptomonospora nanhaiensis]
MSASTNKALTMPLGGRFWALWSASLASNLSDGVAMIAMPWIASSLAPDNAALVALVAAFGRFPWLFLALPAGVLVDRAPRFTLMVASNSLRMLLWGLLAVAVFFGWVSIPLLAVFASAFGALEVCHDTAAETAVTSLVAKERLERANGHLRSGAVVAQEFGGRPLGGLVLALGLFVPFLFNVGALLVSVLALLRVRATAPPADTATTRQVAVGSVSGPFAATGAPRGLRGVGADLAEGARAVWNQPLLRAVAVVAVFVNTAFATMLSTQVLFVRDALGLGPAGFGLLMAFAAVGGIVGGQVVSWLRAALPYGTLPVVCLTGSGLLYLTVALFPSTPVVAGAYFFAGGLVLGYGVAMTSVRQRVTPDRLLGRVNALMRTVTWGMSAVGMALGGVLVSSLSSFLSQADALRAPYALVSAVCLGVVVLFGRKLTRLVRENDV